MEIALVSWSIAPQDAEVQQQAASGAAGGGGLEVLAQESITNRYR